MGTERICPVCKRQPTKSMPDEPRPPGKNIGASHRCPACGPYFLIHKDEKGIDSRPADLKLSAWIREQAEIGSPPPVLDIKRIEWITKETPSPGVAEKMHRLMRAFEKRTPHPGAPAVIDPESDFPLAWAKNKDELHFYIKALIERGLLGYSANGPGHWGHVIISPKGWDYLSEYTGEFPSTDRAFFAMAFGPKEEMDTVYEGGIRPAIEESGYKAVRVDRDPHVEWIEARIIRLIKESKFVIADLTHQNHGAYFEGGYAMGCGKQVIWTVKKSDAGNVRFDTSHINQIRWETVGDLRAKLHDAICAIMGVGPNREDV